jgi:Na+/proline symporter
MSEAAASLSGLDITIIVVYFIVVLAIGIYVSKKTETA